MSRCTSYHFTCDCRDKEIAELRRALKAAYKQLGYLNQGTPKASTNVVLVQLQNILEPGSYRE